MSEKLHILTSPKLHESPLPFLQTFTYTCKYTLDPLNFSQPWTFVLQTHLTLCFQSQTSRPLTSVNLFQQVPSTIFRWTLPVMGNLNKAHEPSKHIQTNFRHLQTITNTLEETSDLQKLCNSKVRLWNPKLLQTYLHCLWTPEYALCTLYHIQADTYYNWNPWEACKPFKHIQTNFEHRWTTMNMFKETFMIGSHQRIVWAVWVHSKGHMRCLKVVQSELERSEELLRGVRNVQVIQVIHIGVQVIWTVCEVGQVVWEFTK